MSVFGSDGKYVLVLHTTTYVLSVQHSCGVVLVFLVLANHCIPSMHAESKITNLSD